MKRNGDKIRRQNNEDKTVFNFCILSFKTYFNTNTLQHRHICL